MKAANIDEAYASTPTRASGCPSSVAQDRASYRFKATVGKARLVSALGQKATCAPQKVMSALPPKADMCGATSDVCFGVAILMNHLRFGPL
jgi:hypothetical protein